MDPGSEEARNGDANFLMKSEPWWVRLYSFKLGTFEDKKAFLKRHSIITGEYHFAMNIK